MLGGGRAVRRDEEGCEKKNIKPGREPEGLRSQKQIPVEKLARGRTLGETGRTAVVQRGGTPALAEAVAEEDAKI